MEGELIYISVIMLFGQIVLLILWSNLSLSKYFKKENFKITKANIMAQNKLQLRKMERELGLSKSKDVLPTAAAPSTNMLSTLTSLAPLLKNLDGDQIMSLADRFLGGSSEGGGGGLESILDNIPPDLIEGFLKGLANTEGAPSGQETGFTSQV